LTQTAIYSTSALLDFLRTEQNTLQSGVLSEWGTAVLPTAADLYSYTVPRTVYPVL